MRKLVILVSALCMALALCLPAGAVQYHVTPLGNLGGVSTGGTTSGWVYGLDPLGRYAAGQSASNVDGYPYALPQAYLSDAATTPPTIQGLGFLPGDTNSVAYGVNSSGDTAGTSYGSSGNQAFYYNKQFNVLVGLGSLNSGSSAGASSWAYDIDDNYVVGQSSSPTGYAAFLSQGTSWPYTSPSSWLMERLPFLSPSAAYRVMNVGNGKLFIAGVQNGQAVLFEKNYRIGPSVATPLPDLPGGGTNSAAHGLMGNSNGCKLVGYASSSAGHEATLWGSTVSGYVAQGLGDLPGGSFFSTAYDIDYYDQVVGVGYSAQGAEGFIWDKYRGMVSLNSLRDSQSSDWWITEARSISESNQVIVGTARNLVTGATEGVLLTPVTMDEDGDGSPFMFDCNDTNPAIYPGAVEVCDGIDNNCWQVDEGFDQDHDGYTTCGGDCNDANAAINPGATEFCDGIDNNCDAQTDEGFDTDGDGFTSCGGDCDNTNPAVNPGATEVCDGIDNDCDAQTDEGLTSLFYRDADSDTFGSASNATSACTLPAGYVTNAMDCNDASAAVHPGATEVCDGIDNNCNAVVDEGFDLDGDGFAVCGGDCDDGNAAIQPGATEICDWVDNDCNPGTADGSGVTAPFNSKQAGVCAGSRQACAGGAWADAYGGIGGYQAVETTCDALDNDCDAQTDEGLMAVFYRDADSDTFGNQYSSTSACTQPAGYVTDRTDCNDAVPAVHPGAPEVVRDGVDQDCNGYDLTIVIGTATWSKGRKMLQVDATSLRGAAAGLVLGGYGPMTYNAKKALWSKSVTGVNASPGTVTVSGPEGSVSASVTTVK